MNNTNPSQDTSNLKIYQKYLELIEYSNNIVRKYPKSENFALVNEIKKSLYVGLRHIMFAIKSFQKQDKLRHLSELDIVPKFIFSTFACLENKGTHKAVEDVQNKMRIFKRNYGDFWILKCDIKKFFYSINPNILFDIMKKYIEDEDLLYLTKILIFDNTNSKDQIGIPIGNYTSQFFANIYLNELDHYVKRILKVKYYIRYMDDFILLLKTKNDCKYMKNQIEHFLADVLNLELNNKSRYYPYKMGVNFCGYRIFTTHRLLRLSSKTKIKRNVKLWNKKYANNCLNIPYTMQSLNSWIGHSNHCNSFKLQQKVISNCDFLYSQYSYKKIEQNLIEDMSNYTIDLE